MEYIIIKILLNYIYYNKYYNYIDLIYYKNNNREIYKILLCLKELHEHLPDKTHSIEELSVFFFTQYSVLKEEERQLFNTIFSKVDSSEVDESILTSYFEKCRENIIASKVAIAALNASQGRGEFTTVIELMSEYEAPPDLEEEFSFLTGEELSNETFRKQGVRWRLECLNKSLGSLRKGDFGFMFARPETGKTTFLASEVTHMASQLDAPVIWFNNEEDGNKVIKRIIQASLGVTQHDLEANLEEYKEAFFTLTKGNLHLYDSGSISRSTAERICKKLNPSLIVFDQLDKITGFEADRYDLKMKAIYQWARELAKTYGPTLGVCQAGGTAEGKMKLLMTDIDSSHTAKQGEADFIIGIGASHDLGSEYSRMINILKNKLDGDDDTLEMLRHSQLPVNIIPTLGRYEDVMRW